MIQKVSGGPKTDTYKHLYGLFEQELRLMFGSRRTLKAWESSLYDGSPEQVKTLVQKVIDKLSDY